MAIPVGDYYFFWIYILFKSYKNNFKGFIQKFIIFFVVYYLYSFACYLFPMDPIDSYKRGIFFIKHNDSFFNMAHTNIYYRLLF